MATQRRESIELYVQGGREELADTERFELAVIEESIKAGLCAINEDSMPGELSNVIAGRVAKAAVTAADVERLEQAIDRLETGLTPLRRFILPGGSLAGALLHMARTVCRRAERRVVGLGPGSVEPELVIYLNRLSDLLFVWARLANHRAGVPDIPWEHEERRASREH